MDNQSILLLYIVYSRNLIDFSFDQPKDRIKYDEIFDTLGPVNGKLVGDQVKPVLLNSGLPTELLGKVIDLSDYQFSFEVIDFLDLGA